MIADLLIGTIATSLLALPGWLLARAWRVPPAALAGFVGGIVAMVNLVLVLDALHAPLTLATVGGTWIVAIVAAAMLAQRHRQSIDAASSAAPSTWREHWPLFLVLVPASLVVCYRAIAQPLSGLDTIFRWDWLARQMLEHRTLSFYPPVSAADYELYSWPDGIAPAVATPYFWIYLLARAARPVLTAPFVIAQFGLIAGAVYALTRRTISDRAGAFAVALLACSPLVLWAVVMGQETGLTALSFVALLLWLPRDRREENRGAIVAAGLAAGLGGLAREYGLAWLALGVGLALVRRLSARSTLVFALTAALGALPWYARNALRTGNPLFNLDVHGWFPINPVHSWLMQEYQREVGWSHLPPETTGHFATYAFAAVVGGVTGVVIYFRLTRAWLAAIAIVTAIWVSSLGYTAAGYVYAVRVLNPALVLAAALGGAAAARFVPARRHLVGASVALFFFGVDAALRGLVYPANPYRIPMSLWLPVGRLVAEHHARPLYRELAARVGGERMIVFGPNAQFTAQGARTLPLWSPEVSFLFAHGIPAETTARRLRELGIGYILLTKAPVNERFLDRSEFFANPAGQLQGLWADDELILLKIVAPPRK